MPVSIMTHVYTNGTKKLWGFKIAAYIQEWSKSKFMLTYIKFKTFLDKYTKW